MCGLKLINQDNNEDLIIVTPFVGVWIETIPFRDISGLIAVTPFVGVWIETSSEGTDEGTDSGHTLRGCVD